MRFPFDTLPGESFPRPLVDIRVVGTGPLVPWTCALDTGNPGAINMPIGLAFIAGVLTPDNLTSYTSVRVAIFDYRLTGVRMRIPIMVTGVRGQAGYQLPTDVAFLNGWPEDLPFGIAGLTFLESFRLTVTAAVVRDLQDVHAGRCACGGAGRRAAAAVMINRDKQSRSGSRGCHGI